MSTETVERRHRTDIQQADLLRQLEAAGKLRFVRMIRPDRAAKKPREFVVDYGQGETVIRARDLFGWVAGFEAGLAASPTAAPALVETVEDMEQTDLRKLSRVVNAELKRRKS